MLCYLLGERFSVQLIHSADPQSRPVVITVFINVVRPSVSTLQNRAKQKHFQVKKVIAPGGTMGLAERIIDDTCLFIVIVLVFQICVRKGIFCIVSVFFASRFRDFIVIGQNKYNNTTFARVFYWEIAKFCPALIKLHFLLISNELNYIFMDLCLSSRSLLFLCSIPFAIDQSLTRS